MPSGQIPGRRDAGHIDPQVETRVREYTRGAELAPVAQILRGSREQVLLRWLAAANGQEFHRARPDAAVADHIPRLYDALVAVLEDASPREQDAQAPATDPRVISAAHAHADVRFEQGLTPTDVATEFRLLRQETWRALREHVGRHLGAHDLLAAELLINDGIDAAITTALAALEAHEAERLRLRGELAAIVESSCDAIIGMTLDGIITSWNPAAERLYGYSTSKALGQPISLISPPDRRDEVTSMLARIGQGERVEPRETEGLRKGGTRVEVSITVSPIRDTSGVVVGASAIARDFTERRRGEQALRESEERFRMLADHMAQLAWMADPNGSIFWYNRRWFEYTGAAFDQMEGSAWMRVHPDHVDRVVAHFRDAVDRGEIWEDTFPLRGKDGQYCWFLSRAQPIRDHRGRIVRWFGTNTDVTELRQAEDALRRSEEDRLGLLAAVAHDLRNPLANIKGLTQLLQRQARAGRLTPERLADRLGALVASADRMSAQLDELNLVAGQGGQALELSVQPTDVIALVREAAAARQLGSDTHRIEVETNVEELVGSVDATRLARVVDNLLANAAKYSPAGRDIKVQVQRVEFESQPWAVLAVRDEGIGIPPADLAHIFERFRRGGNVGSIPGSGVGLAAAREIVEAHGGTIAAESSGGAGSTFTVRLPLAE